MILFNLLSFPTPFVFFFLFNVSSRADIYHCTLFRHRPQKTGNLKAVYLFFTRIVQKINPCINFPGAPFQYLSYTCSWAILRLSRISPKNLPDPPVSLCGPLPPLPLKRRHLENYPIRFLKYTKNYVTSNTHFFFLFQK